MNNKLNAKVKIDINQDLMKQILAEFISKRVNKTVDPKDVKITSRLVSKGDYRESWTETEYSATVNVQLEEF